MPIRLPNTPGQPSNAIGAPQASMRAAVAPSLALGNVASALAGLGQEFHATAIQAQQAENTTKASAFRQNLALEYGKLQGELEKEPDGSKRLARTTQFLAEKYTGIDDENLPPALRREMATYFDEFATNAKIQQGEQIARLNIRQADITTREEMEVEKKNFNLPGIKRAFDSRVEAGVSDPAEWPSIERQAKEYQQEMETIARIDQDPVGFLESPVKSNNPIKDQQYLDRAQGNISKNISGAWDEFEDFISVNPPLINTPEEIDAQWVGLVPPRTLEKMKGHLASRQNAAQKFLHTTTAYQDTAVGSASSMLEAYNPSAPDAFDQYSDIVDTINTLPAGSGSREQLRERLDRIQQGFRDDFKDAAEAGRSQIIEGITARYIAPATKEQSVTALVGSGFLEDRGKLALSGLSPESLEYITGKNSEGKLTADGKKLTTDERKRRFLEKYPQRANKLTAQDPFVDAAFNAIQRGDEKVRYVEPQAERQGKRILGEVLRKYNTSIRLQPDKANDETFIREKQYEAVRPFGLDSFRGSLLPPAPTGPSTIPLDGPLPEIPRGETMDFTPGVLPPLGP